MYRSIIIVDSKGKAVVQRLPSYSLGVPMQIALSFEFSNKN